MKRISPLAFATLIFGACLFVAKFFVSVNPLRSPAQADQFQHLTEFFQNEVDTHKIPGAVILIQQHGHPIYQKFFGVRDVKTGLPMSADTIFALHSMTKPITSVAAMMLVDEGKLSVNDPLSKYIPEFANVKVGVETKGEDGQPYLRMVPSNREVTIEDVLRHTSGMTYEYIGGPAIMKAYNDANIYAGQFDNKIFAERMAQLPLSRQPGTLWRYGHSTDVLGRVIEIISGQTLYQFEKSHIFDPLGMTSTEYVIKESERNRKAEPLPNDTILLAAEKDRRDHPEWESGGGGLISTVTDYGIFAQMILNGGKYNGQQILTPETFKMMTTDHVGPETKVDRDYWYFPGDGFGFGYGFAVRTAAGHALPPPVGSMGELKWDSGSGTYFGVDPKLDMFYIMLMQTQNERGRITPRFRELVYEGFGAM